MVTEWPPQIWMKISHIDLMEKIKNQFYGFRIVKIVYKLK